MTELQPPRLLLVAPIDGVLDHVDAACRLHGGGDRAAAPRELVRLRRLVLVALGRHVEPSAFVRQLPHHRRADAAPKPRYGEGGAWDAGDDRVVVPALSLLEQCQEELVVEQVVRVPVHGIGVDLVHLPGPFFEVGRQTVGPLLGPGEEVQAALPRVPLEVRPKGRRRQRRRAGEAAGARMCIYIHASMLMRARALCSKPSALTVMCVGDSKSPRIALSSPHAPCSMHDARNTSPRR